MYRYSLDKSSKKFRCPRCLKNRFVRFLNNETGNYLANQYGRCDREQKCGYFLKPTENNNQNSLLAKAKPTATTQAIKPTFHDKSLLVKFSSRKQLSNFVIYLLKHFDNKTVWEVIKKYRVGTSNHWQNATVFWQIDADKKIRCGKIMLYNCNTGKRVKNPYNHITWMHKQLKLDDFVLQQCLFGLHNVNCITKRDTICIVESEKTAIIMSIVLQNKLWLATGSIANFKEKLLRPIKEYSIIAYPDKHAFKDWHKTAIKLNKIGYHVQCSSFLEKEDIENGGDLVDYITSQ